MINRFLNLSKSFFTRFHISADDDSLMLHQKWVAECVKRGIFITSHHNHFINAALTEEDIKKSIDIAEDAFNALRKLI